MAVCCNWRANDFMVVLIGLILSSFCLGGGDGSIVNGSCMESERKALLAIKADIYDPDQWLSSWRGHDCCQWRGVGCHNITGHVVKLNLRYPYDFQAQLETKKYPGPSKLNPSLLDLMHLKYLDLSMNNFSRAPIPKFIGSLMYLEYLNLSSAKFNGFIPPELGNLSRLHFLDISSNYYYYYYYADDYYYYYDYDYDYESSLHADNLLWLSNISSLHLLDMSFVNLSKATNWFHEINMLPSLSVLRLSYADLPIVFPFISHLNLTSLTTLDLSANYHINTPISHWLFNISSLAHLNLAGCYLTDRSLFAIENLYNLQLLDLTDNQITGEVFQNLGNLSRLEHLHMSFNRISRDKPKSIGNLCNLEELDFTGNEITREVFEHFRNLSHLKHLRMGLNKISGEMPKEIGNLRNLEELDLFDNQNISGEIPKIFGNLIHLQVLDLSGNILSGKMPEIIGNLIHLQMLRYLMLGMNRFTGEIPEIMENFIHLQKLDLSYNNISGEIPDLFGKLHSLRLLELDRNHITGKIPRSIWNLNNLETLSLSNNKISGDITEAHFANFAKLEILDLSYNSFQVILNQDWIPPFNAWRIVMSSCHLGPKFPAWLQTQTDLGHLDLSKNNISDSIPTWFWDLKHVYYLNVSHNSITGGLPISVRGQRYHYFDVSFNNIHGAVPELDASFLYSLHINNNSFSGPIPLNLAKATKLQFLLLSHNNINGSIPLFLYNLSSLEVLDLSNNNLSGDIHLFFSNLTWLEVLDLSSNNLSGGLHHYRDESRLGAVDSQEDNKLKNFSNSMVCPINLQSLHMRNNSLSGKFPSLLKYCEQLVVLDLSENMLSGNLPIWIGESLIQLRVLSLRSNFFKGKIPTQLSHLTSLQVLDLACNNFSSILPLTFGNFRGMMVIHNGNESFLTDVNAYYTESLSISSKGIEIVYTSVLSFVTGIDLSHNNLSGVIPKELVNLHGLNFLNLSNNHFIGEIPENIGALEQLESLDLSVNNLSGVIPSSISSLYYLSHLNLSDNNLSGSIPSGNQIQTFCDPSIYSGNPNLHGWPLPWCSNDAPSKSPFWTGAHEEEVGKKEVPVMIWLYVGFAIGFAMGFWGLFYAIMVNNARRIAYFQLIDKTSYCIYVQSAIRFAKLKAILMGNNQG